jgi:hypothetical protein
MNKPHPPRSFNRYPTPRWYPYHLSANTRPLPRQNFKKCVTWFSTEYPNQQEQQDIHPAFIKPIHGAAPVPDTRPFASFFTIKIAGIQGIYGPSPDRALSSNRTVLLLPPFIRAGQFHVEGTVSTAQPIKQI